MPTAPSGPSTAGLQQILAQITAMGPTAPTGPATSTLIDPRTGQRMPSVLPAQTRLGGAVSGAYGRGQGAAQWLGTPVGQSALTGQLAGGPSAGVAERALPMRPSQGLRALNAGQAIPGSPMAPTGAVPQGVMGMSPNGFPATATQQVPGLGSQVASAAPTTASVAGSAAQAAPTFARGPLGAFAENAMARQAAGKSLGTLGTKLATAGGAQVTPFAAEGAGRLATGLKAGGAIRGGLYGLGGTLAATHLIDPLDVGGKNSNLDRGLTGAIGGAGIGAGLGSMVMPGLGTAVGALGGAAIGGVGNILMGSSDDASKKKEEMKFNSRLGALSNLATKVGMTSSDQKDLLTQVNVGLELAGDDKTARKTILDQAENAIKTYTPNPMSPERMLGMQAAIANYMQPQTERSRNSAYANAAVFDEIAGRMSSPAVADAVRLQAANRRASADEQAAAYLNSAQALPALMAIQAAQAQAQSGGGSSDDSLAALAQAAGG